MDNKVDYAAHPPIKLLANEQVIWVYQHHVAEEGLQLVRFAYQPFDGKFKKRFWGGPVVTGAVVQSTLAGEDIDVIFGDGTHKLFSPLHFGPDQSVSPTTLELSLPDGALPMALTADGQRGVLYAVVTARVAEKIVADAYARLERLREYDRDDDDDLIPSSDVEPDSERAKNAAHSNDAASDAPPILAGNVAIARYEQGYWKVDRAGPEMPTSAHRVEAIFAQGDQLTLATVDSTGVTEVLSLWESQEPDALFGVRGTTRLADAPLDLTLSVCGDDLCAAAILAHEQNAVASVMRLTSDGWTPPVALKNAEGQPLTLPVSSSIAFAGDKLAVAFAMESEPPSIGLWSIDTGEPVAAPVAADVLANTPSPTIAPIARQFLHYAVLGVVVAVVFFWRRERVVNFAPLRADQIPARMERRLLAVIVDLAILSPIWVPLVFMLWRSGAPHMSVAEQLMYRQPQQSTPLFWAGAVVGGAYAVYGAILELTIGRTLGKRVTRCEVVGEGGERCAARAILIRNALRVVEFHFLPVALLVALTPSRQRLGDMLARTVVIERLVGPPTVDELVDDGASAPDSDEGKTPPSEYRDVRSYDRIGR